jgi:hypothetical protein
MLTVEAKDLARAKGDFRLGITDLRDASLNKIGLSF